MLDSPPPVQHEVIVPAPRGSSVSEIINHYYRQMCIREGIDPDNPPPSTHEDVEIRCEAGPNGTFQAVAYKRRPLILFDPHFLDSIEEPSLPDPLKIQKAERELQVALVAHEEGHSLSFADGKFTLSMRDLERLQRNQRTHQAGSQKLVASSAVMWRTSKGDPIERKSGEYLQPFKIYVTDPTDVGLKEQLAFILNSMNSDAIDVPVLPDCFAEYLSETLSENRFQFAAVIMTSATPQDIEQVTVSDKNPFDIAREGAKLGMKMGVVNLAEYHCSLFTSFLFTQTPQIK